MEEYIRCPRCTCYEFSEINPSGGTSIEFRCGCCKETSYLVFYETGDPAGFKMRWEGHPRTHD